VTCGCPSSGGDGKPCADSIVEDTEGGLHGRGAAYCTAGAGSFNEEPVAMEALLAMIGESVDAIGSA